MAELLSPHLAQKRDEAAVTDQDRTVTWAGLDDRVNRWIHLLRGSGLSVGDRVAVLSGNRHEAFEAALACLQAGFTLVPVNWHLTATEIAYILADSGSRAIIIDDERAATAADAVAGADTPWLVKVVTGGQPVAGFAALEPLLAAAAATEPEDQCSGSVLLYTSGTSGRPKGVVTSLFSTGAPLAAIAGLLGVLGQALSVPDVGRTLLVGPWYHSGQLFFSLFPLLRGSSLLVRRGFDAAELVELIDRERVTHTHLVPIHFIRLLRVPEAARAALRGDTLRVVWHGAAACPVDVKRAMIEWWGPVFTEYYAATEGGIATVIDSAQWLEHPGSVGRSAPPTELVIVGPDGETLPPHTDGMIYLRRPPERGFKYHNAPEKTRTAYLDDRTFTYGDIGHLDADGYLYVTGRATDMVITGGVNVYPAEVESVLLSHPAVRDAAVFGVPDPEYGERVTAAVVVGPDAGDDIAEVLDRHCRTRLAGFKVPRHYKLVADLPRDPSGKLRKHLLTAEHTPAPVG